MSTFPNMESGKNPEPSPGGAGLNAGPKASVGACDHFQPSDLAALAEEYLRGKGVPENLWQGSRFGHGGGGGSGPFKSVYMEVERRGANWVAVKLDRRKADMAPEERGFKILNLPEGARALIDPA
jgi:hypothetical protein